MFDLNATFRHFVLRCLCSRLEHATLASFEKENGSIEVHEPLQPSKLGRLGTLSTEASSKATSDSFSLGIPHFMPNVPGRKPVRSHGTKKTIPTPLRIVYRQL